MRVHQKNGRASVKLFVDIDSKQTLVDQLEDAGWTLFIDTGHQTDWGTPLRKFSAYTENPYRSVDLDVVERGERPDWQGMFNHWEKVKS